MVNTNKQNIIKNALPVLIFVVIMVFTGIAYNQKTEVLTKNYYGEWKVSRFYSPNRMVDSEAGPLSSEEIKTYAGEPVIFQKTQADIFGNECNTDNSTLKYSKSNENASQYFYDNYKVVTDTKTGSTTALNKENLGIKSDSIEIFELKCNSNYYTLFVLDNEEIIVEFRNTFFSLVKS